MEDNCLNCGKSIPAYLELEYCNKCSDMDYGFISALGDDSN